MPTKSQKSVMLRWARFWGTPVGSASAETQEGVADEGVVDAVLLAAAEVIGLGFGSDDVGVMLPDPEPVIEAVTLGLWFVTEGLLVAEGLFVTETLFVLDGAVDNGAVDDAAVVDGAIVAGGPVVGEALLPEGVLDTVKPPLEVTEAGG